MRDGRRIDSGRRDFGHRDVQRRQLAPERFAQVVQRGLGRRIDRRPGRRREPIAGTDDDDRRASGAPQSRQEAADQVNGAFEVRSGFLRKVEAARWRRFWKRWRPRVSGPRRCRGA